MSTNQPWKLATTAVGDHNINNNSATSISQTATSNRVNNTQSTGVSGSVPQQQRATTPLSAEQQAIIHSLTDQLHELRSELRNQQHINNQSNISLSPAPHVPSVVAIPNFVQMHEYKAFYEMQSKMESLERLLEARTEEVKRLKKETVEWQHQHSAAAGEAAQHKLMLVTAQMELQTSKAERETIRQELYNAKRMTEEMSAQVHKLTHEKKTLERTIVEHETKKNNAVAQAEQLQVKVDSMAKENDASKGTVAARFAELRKSHEIDRNEMQMIIEELQRKVQQQAPAFTTLQQRLEDESSQIRGLHESLKLAQHQAHQWQVRAEELTSNQHQLLKQLDEVKHVKALEEDQLVARTRQLEDCMVSISKLQHRVVELETIERGLRQQCTSITESYSTVQHEVHDAIKNSNRLQVLLDNATMSLQSSTAEVALLKEQMLVARASVEGSQKANQSAVQQMYKAMGERDSIQSVLMERDRTIQGLQDMNKTLTKQAQEAKVRESEFRSAMEGTWAICEALRSDDEHLHVVLHKVSGISCTCVVSNGAHVMEYALEGVRDVCRLCGATSLTGRGYVCLPCKVTLCVKCGDAQLAKKAITRDELISRDRRIAALEGEVRGGTSTPPAHSSSYWALPINNYPTDRTTPTNNSNRMSTTIPLPPNMVLENSISNFSNSHPNTTGVTTPLPATPRTSNVNIVSPM